MVTFRADHRKDHGVWEKNLMERRAFGSRQAGSRKAVG
jgi:hypothetical protein